MSSGPGQFSVLFASEMFHLLPKVFKASLWLDEQNLEHLHSWDAATSKETLYLTCICCLLKVSWLSALHRQNKLIRNDKCHVHGLCQNTGSLRRWAHTMKYIFRGVLCSDFQGGYHVPNNRASNNEGCHFFIHHRGFSRYRPVRYWPQCLSSGSCETDTGQMV